MPFNGPADLRREVSASAGIELDRIMALTVGRTGMAIARLVTDGDEIPLRGVRKVEIGIYEVNGLRPGVDARGAIGLPRLEGWHSVVRVRDDEQEVHILLEERDDQIRGMIIVVAEDEEVVLIRIRGKLQHTVEQAMRMAFDQADRPELYEPTVAEYRKQAAEAG
jgi:hypothetical protein